MIEHSELLKAAAGQIDGLDREIANSNSAKKDIYANIRETISPADFKAWRDAVRLRQKRAVSEEARDAIAEHDERVWELLAMLEAETVQVTGETRVAPVSGPANGIGTEMPSHVRVAREENLDRRSVA